MNNRAAPGKPWKSMITGNLQLVAVILIPLIVGAFRPNFLTPANFHNVLFLSSVLIISSLGFALVLQCGSVDLSIEANMALAGVVVASLLRINPDLGVLTIAAAMVVSAFAGLVNGLIHTKLKIPSFMTTLGTSFIIAGISTIITQGHFLTFEDRGIRALAIGRIGGPGSLVPNTTIIAIAVMVIIWFISEKFKYGRHVVAVGGDELVAKDLGVNIDRTKIISFVIAGASFGLAGALLTLQLGIGDTFSSAGYTFETISACVVGGIAMSGGVGRMYKAVLGAIIITMVRSGMVFFTVPSAVQAGILGTIIILTVAATLDRSKLSSIK